MPKQAKIAITHKLLVEEIGHHHVVVSTDFTDNIGHQRALLKGSLDSIGSELARLGQGAADNALLTSVSGNIGHQHHRMTGMLDSIGQELARVQHQPVADEIAADGAGKVAPDSVTLRLAEAQQVSSLVVEKDADGNLQLTLNE